MFCGQGVSRGGALSIRIVKKFINNWCIVWRLLFLCCFSLNWEGCGVIFLPSFFLFKSFLVWFFSNHYHCIKQLSIKSIFCIIVEVADKQTNKGLPCVGWQNVSEGKRNPFITLCLHLISIFRLFRYTKGHDVDLF